MKLGFRQGLFALLCSLPALAYGADNQGVQGRLFQPNIDGLGIHSVDSVDVLDPFAIAVNVFFDHAINPVERGGPGDRRIATLVGEQGTFEFSAAVGLPYGLSLAATVPLGVDQDGHQIDTGKNLDEVGRFDARIELKSKLWVDDSGVFGLGAKLLVTIPRGASNQNFRSEDGQSTVGGLILAERRFERLRLLGELGYQWIEEDIKVGGAHVDDRVLAGFGIDYLLWTSEGHDRLASRTREPSSRTKKAQEKGEPAPEEEWYALVGQVSLDASWRFLHPSDEITRPIELDYGLRFESHYGVALEVGGGSGLTNGIGAPDYRMFCGLRVLLGGFKASFARFAKLAAPRQ